MEKEDAAPVEQPDVIDINAAEWEKKMTVGPACLIFACVAVPAASCLVCLRCVCVLGGGVGGGGGFAHHDLLLHPCSLYARVPSLQALHFAITLGRLEMVRLLISQGAKADTMVRAWLRER